MPSPRDPKSATRSAQERALGISDVLRGRNISHTIRVHVSEKHWPGEQWTVEVKPSFIFEPDEIEALQSAAAANGSRLGWVADSFVFSGGADA